MLRGSAGQRRFSVLEESTGGDVHVLFSDKRVIAA